MYAVIRTGGKQYRVKEGQVLRLEKLMAKAGEEVELNDVLLIANGETINVARAQLAGAKVIAKVMEHGRHKKIDVIKFKRRKNYRRTQGHKQHYTQVKITKIEA